MTIDLVQRDAVDTWVAAIIDLHGGVLQTVSAMTALLHVASTTGPMDHGTRQNLHDILERQHAMVITLMDEAALILNGHREAVVSLLE